MSKTTTNVTIGKMTRYSTDGSAEALIYVDGKAFGHIEKQISDNAHHDLVVVGYEVVLDDADHEDRYFHVRRDRIGNPRPGAARVALAAAKAYVRDVLK